MHLSCTAGIVEHVAWTNGSMHDRVQPYNWTVFNVTDVTLFLVTGVVTVLGSGMLLGIYLLWRMHAGQRKHASANRVTE